jgi:hypothetical protein
MVFQARPSPERFHASYAIEPATGCWLWQRGIGSGGYAVFCLGKDMGGPRNTPASRAAWLLLRGPIPPGYEADHMVEGCPRHCVNPDHLQVIPKRANLAKSNAPHARNARATHCKHGHLFDEANTYRDKSGYRHCRRCAVQRVLEHGQRYRRGEQAANAATLDTARDLAIENAQLKAENQVLRERVQGLETAVEAMRPRTWEGHHVPEHQEPRKPRPRW